MSARGLMLIRWKKRKNGEAVKGWTLLITSSMAFARQRASYRDLRVLILMGPCKPENTSLDATSGAHERNHWRTRFAYWMETLQPSVMNHGTELLLPPFPPHLHAPAIIALRRKVGSLPHLPAVLATQPVGQHMCCSNADTAPLLQAAQRTEGPLSRCEEQAAL